MNKIEQFKEERIRLNDIVHKYSGKEIKRFFSLDSQVYRPGAISVKHKELMGLVASLCMRCDDCIKYHIIQCYDNNVTSKELEEALSIALIVGGSIMIPHLRRACEVWEELNVGFDETDYKFRSVIDKINNFICAENGKMKVLKFVAEILESNFEHYDWVGFYFADNANKMLNLGPYIGEETDHIEIPFGKGICGQSAETEDTFVVDDIAKETNYLACSLKVKSEIVVPIMKDDIYKAQLDIDSHRISPFTDKDRIYLEKICSILAEIF